MSIKPLDDGRYEVDIRPCGKNGIRYRRVFNKKSEAKAFELYTLANANNKEWTSKKADRRSLKDLIEIWWEYYGQTIKNGAIEKRHLIKTAIAMDNPTVNSLDKKMLMQHRSRRLASGISAATINRDLYRLSGMFTTLIKIDEFKGAHPITGLPPLKENTPEMVFLIDSEISRLLELATGDMRRVALLCLSTGARWGEAISLRSQQIIHGRVTFLDTKNGSKRVIPISAELEKALKKKETGKLFKVDYEKFCDLLREVKPDMPRGQATHVMRHTFASHFMMNGGNIITLKEILGHATINQTMIYAHFAPDFLQHAVSLNPLRGGIVTE